METTQFKKIALSAQMMDASQISDYAENTFIRLSRDINLETISLSGNMIIGEGQTCDTAYPALSGKNSVAIGPSSKALNEYTIAISKGQAIGDHTVALCYGKAFGGYSVAYGSDTSCFGYASHAEGILAQTGEKDHVADSYYKQMCGTASHVEGIGNKVIGSYSHAEGRVNTVNSDYSHAEGYHTVVGNRNYVIIDHERYDLCGEIWYDSNSNVSNTISIEQYGLGAHAEGNSCSAFGNFSHVEGVKAATLSSDSFAYVWNGLSTTNYTSHGEGTFNINPKDGLSGFFIGSINLCSILSGSIKPTQISDTYVNAAELYNNILVLKHNEPTIEDISVNMSSVQNFTLQNDIITYSADKTFTDNNLNVVHVPDNDGKLVNSDGSLSKSTGNYKWYQIDMPFDMNVYGPVTQNTLVAVYSGRIDKECFICRYRSWDATPAFPTKDSPLTVKAGQTLVICPNGYGFSLKHDDVSLSSTCIKPALLRSDTKLYSIKYSQKPFNNVTSDFEFYSVFQRTDDVSSYIKYDIVHNTVVDKKSDNWRLARVSIVDSFGNTVCRIVNNPELNAAIEIAQGTDKKLIGGEQHGYEKDQQFTLFVDGNPILNPYELSVLAYADSIQYGEKTNYYNPHEDTALNTKIGSHYVQYEFANGKVSVKQHIIWLSSMSLNNAYMPMLGVANYNGYVNANRFRSYDVEDDTVVITRTDLSDLPYSDTAYNYTLSATSIDIFSTEHTTHSVMTVNKQVKNQQHSHKLTVQNNGTKTTAKAYNVVCSNSNVNPNDKWETEATYEFKLK